MEGSALMEAVEGRRDSRTRRIPFHVWALHPQRVAEVRPRTKGPVQPRSDLAEAGAEEAGRPRANRAEDWSRRPPEEGCLGLEPVAEVASAAAAAAAARDGMLSELRPMSTAPPVVSYNCQCLGHLCVDVGCSKADLPHRML